jgi:DNA mismatch repair ATPase MutS
VDRIFTRIGLHDYTLRGHSSFMVEMIELPKYFIKQHHAV